MSEGLDKALQRLITLVNTILVFVIIGIVASIGIGLGTIISARTVNKRVQEQIMNTTTANITESIDSRRSNYRY